jgi:hypothetical protein
VASATTPHLTRRIARRVSPHQPVHAGTLIATGIPARRACRVATVQGLTAAAAVQRSIEEAVSSSFE